MREFLAKIKAKLAGAMRSWTIRANTVMGVAVVVVPMLKDDFPSMQGILPDTLYKVAMGTILAVNFALRFKTKKPLEER